jgi:tyrosinase
VNNKVLLLLKNKGWLTKTQVVDNQPLDRIGVGQQYIDCLSAPNYTVFSNTTSAQQWNATNSTYATPLEEPHNCIHLAVGGFDVPPDNEDPSATGANGDMGENNTAALDPIFFFHHCFVDYVFWQWQLRNKSTDSLELIPSYPGTNSVDGQGATPGVSPNSWVDLTTTSLAPFNKNGVPCLGQDMVNITNLGYSYGPGSLDLPPSGATAARKLEKKLVRVTGINRSWVSGSFTVSARATLDSGAKVLLGTRAVLSRWNVAGCMNCQNHLDTQIYFPLPANVVEKMKDAKASSIQVVVQTRDGSLKKALSKMVESNPVPNFVQHFARPIAVAPNLYEVAILDQPN